MADSTGEGPVRSQVAEVVVTAAGGRRRGSGYRVAVDAVLTSAHVVADAESVILRFEPDLPGEWTVEAESWSADPLSDVAVVSIPPDGRPVKPALFSRVTDRAAVLAVQAVGFPRWKMRTYGGTVPSDIADEPRYRDACHIVGSVNVLSNWREGTLELVIGSAPAPSADGGSPWEGMSGAALWADGRIIGVVAEHHPGDGLARLAAARLDRARFPAITLPEEVHDLSGSPAVWNVPPRLATFTGRSSLLDRIAEHLRSPGNAIAAVTALRGLGGVGKTQLVVEYAWRHRSDYEVVWWIDAEQPGLLAEKIAALGNALGLPASRSVPDQAAAVLERLRRTDRWLLIFDNVTTASDIRPWLPSGPGHVLITSRNRQWGAVAARVDVDVLERDEAIGLLRRHLATMDDGIADELAAELGDLPLALAQTTAYLERTEMPAEAYLAKFRLRRDQMLGRGEDQIHGGRIDTVWSISLERLRTAAPATVQMLQLAAFCAPEPIPLTLFADHPELLPAPLSLAAGGEDPAADLDDVVAAALDYSLCRRRSEAIQLHRLLQAVIQAQLSGEQRAENLDTLVSVLEAADPGDADRPDSWARWTVLGPHLLHVSRMLPEDSISLDSKVSQFCWHFVARGDYAAAQRIAAEFHERRKRTLGQDHDNTLRWIGNLSAVLDLVGETQAAYDLCLEAVNRTRQNAAADTRRTLYLANSLVSRLRALGRDDEACELGKDTLQRCRQALGDDNGLTLATAGNLAGALVITGEVETARALAEDTLRRHRQVFGVEHRETQWAASVLVEVRAIQGDYLAALELAGETLGVYQRLFGDSHPDAVRLSRKIAEIKGQLAGRSPQP